MSSESEILLSETIKDLENVRQLLQKVVLMAPKAFLGPDLFIRLECLELYDPDRQVCVQGLRRERISRIREFDLMLQELQSTVDKVNEPRLSWGPLNNRPLIKPLFDDSRPKFLSNLYRELERIRSIRDSWAMEHHRLQVKSDLYDFDPFVRFYKCQLHHRHCNSVVINVIDIALTFVLGHPEQRDGSISDP
ncbi:hypothetical protein BGZ83_008564 [Gryganskiella cystojenkinii]|nr:hypothetical protein BGZ83_008564 [Gryganskiella cystojenkinii]